jgi:hypothetical protein
MHPEQKYDPMTRITYDASVDMAYTYLREIAAGGVATTVPDGPTQQRSVSTWTLISTGNL